MANRITRSATGKRKHKGSWQYRSRYQGQQQEIGQGGERELFSEAEGKRKSNAKTEAWTDLNPCCSYMLEDRNFVL